MLCFFFITPSAMTFATSVFLAQFLVGSLEEISTSNQETNAEEKAKPKEQNDQRFRRTEKLVEEKLLSKPNREIDELCSELDQTCFLIIDKLEKRGDKLLAFRQLRRKGPEGVLRLSETRIQPPSPLKWTNFNTKSWQIRKDTVRLIYARFMILGTFLSGALEFNTTRKQDVLIIGLGGGVINNYLTSMPYQTILFVKLNVTVVDIDPVMKKIAQKWFGFQESPLHRIIIDDGVRFIRDAARRGEKYDVILVDVSYNVRLPLMGPTEDFLKDEVIAHLRAITAENGATIVNIVTSKEAKEDAYPVYLIYSRHFPSCYLLTHGNNDRMLFCSAKEKNAYKDKPDEFYERFVALDKALGFVLNTKGQCVMYPLD